MVELFCWHGWCSYKNEGAGNFNADISAWDVSGVTDMKYMFFGAGDFNYPIGQWNVGAVTRMRSMFDSTRFNQPLSDWNVNEVRDMYRMFRKAWDFQNGGNQDLSW